MNQKVESSYTLELGTNGRIVLPAEVRKRFDFKAGDVMLLRVKDDGTLELRSGKDVAQKTRGVLKSMKPKKRGKRAKGA
jgi:AbrB family looped-hinge helix DNA binding protein